MLATVLAGCATNERADWYLGPAVGSAAGGPLPALTPIDGAVVGAAVGGISGAVWADADNDGYADGFVYEGEYHAGRPAMAAPSGPPLDGSPRGERDDYYESAPPPPPPEPPRDAYRDGDDYYPRPARASLANAAWRLSSASLRTRSMSLQDVRSWQTGNGALHPRALQAILEQCVADFGEIGAECLDEVRFGNGVYGRIPPSARLELAHIYRTSCQSGESQDECIRKLQSASQFRALPRGGLTLGPTTMREKVRTLFTAQIRDTGEIEGRAGQPTAVGFEADPDRPGTERRIEVVPVSARMCFVLSTDNPELAKIEAKAGQGRTIDSPNRICMTAKDGTAATKFDPSWWVTPLSGKDFGLKLDLEHYVGTLKQDYPQEPRPIPIKVIGEPSDWERLDAFLEHATGTANLATKLAGAIGALIAAVMGWKIWGLLKRRKKARK